MVLILALANAGAQLLVRVSLQPKPRNRLSLLAASAGCLVVASLRASAVGPTARLRRAERVATRVDARGAATRVPGRGAGGLTAVISLTRSGTRSAACAIAF